jgi:hypothetical protein
MDKAQWETPIVLINRTTRVMMEAFGPSSPETVGTLATSARFCDAAGNAFSALTSLIEALDLMEAPEAPDGTGPGGGPPRAAPAGTGWP